MPTPSPPRTERLLLLAALLLVLGGFKLAFNPGIGRNSLDGDYYFQIARHVSEGDGLQTSLSLYHQGLQSFPHPTNAAPMWPLVLGYSGRLLGLYPAAVTLPELFYLVVLALLYRLAHRLAIAFGRDPALLAPGGVLTVGHAAVVVLGFNPVFFEFTSLPYTEGLAFVLLLSALLLGERAVSSGGWGAAVLAGIAAGAAFLTRSQLVGVLVGVPAAALLAGFARRRNFAVALVIGGAAALTIVPWVVFLAGWADPFHWKVMLGAYQATPEVEPFNSRVEVASTGEYLLNRWRGLVLAFRVGEPNSYFASFAWAIFLLPLAILQSLFDRERWAGLLRRACEPSRFLAVATPLTGALMLAPVHNAHFWYFKEWLFGFRHGLPLVLVLAAALAYLAAHGRPAVRWLALALVAGSLFDGARDLGVLQHRRFASGLLPPEPELVEWLAAHERSPAVITTNAQTLAAFSRAGYHWMVCREPATQTLALLEHAGADYVLQYPGEERCPFLRGLDDRLRTVETFEFQGARLVVKALRAPTAE